MQKTNSKRTVQIPLKLILVFAVLALACTADAQLGNATLDGLCINARSLYLSGDTRDMDCTIGMDFWGRKLSDDVQILPVRVIRATSDTGAELEWKDTWNSRTIFSQWQSIMLKHCLRSLKSINLEGEIELLTPAVPYPVFTNFLTNAGKALRHPTLEQHGIELRCVRPEGSPPTDFEIQVDDPRGEFLGLSFRWPDGGEASGFVTPKGSRSFDVRKKTFAYSCMRAGATNLNLKVRIAVPKNSEKLPFKIKIRPPWIDPDELQTTVTGVRVSKYGGDDAAWYWTSLTFAGGPLTNAVGIWRMRITKAELSNGERMELRQNDRWWAESLARCSSIETESGRTVFKLIPLHMKAARAASIRVLEGDVGLFKPTLDNEGLLEITNLFNPGKLIEHPTLKKAGVEITYLGRANFRNKTNEWANSPNGWVISGGNYDAPAGVEDSILFSTEDPNRCVLSVDAAMLEFLDEKGGAVFPKKTVSSSTFHLYTFGTIPKIARARLYFPSAGSIQRVSFKVENVPLP